MPPPQQARRQRNEVPLEAIETSLAASGKAVIPYLVAQQVGGKWAISYGLAPIANTVFWSTGMESLTSEFEHRVTAFPRRTRLPPSEFAERACGDRKFLGDMRWGRSPRLVTADRVLAFMAAYGRPHGAGGPGTHHWRRRKGR